MSAEHSPPERQSQPCECEAFQVLDDHQQKEQSYPHQRITFGYAPVANRPAMSSKRWRMKESKVVPISNATNSLAEVKIQLLCDIPCHHAFDPLPLSSEPHWRNPVTAP